MQNSFDNKCPYCGSNDLESYGNIDDLSIAVDSEEYLCKGKCERTFYVQNLDEQLIMKPTMNNKYLSINSLAFVEKEKFENIAINQGIEKELPVCGNCVSYEWGTNIEDNFDRHCGSCYFQHNKYNYTTSDYFIKRKLHALTNASQCDNFFNFRIE
jgi:transposase-like protein